MGDELRPGATQSVSFGAFRLNAVDRVLERDGAPVRVGGRALDVLIALIERAGQILSHKDICSRVWPTTPVTDNSLRFQIRALRRALGEGADGTKYLINIPGRGYSFVSPILDGSDPAANPTTAPSPSGVSPSAITPPTNLPRRYGKLFGRNADLARLGEKIEQARLLTLSGPGGMGKTTLAIELGWQVSGRFPHGVWLVDLAPLGDAMQVVSALAAILKVPVNDTATAIQHICKSISSNKTLIIFDNCEYLIQEISPILHKLLADASGLSVITTGQKVTGLAEEEIYRVGPLDLPPTNAREIGQFSAVQLFVERAQTVVRTFELNEKTVGNVAEICRRLDGVPLALEMASGRLPLLGLEALCQGLNARLRMLRSNFSPLEVRHRSLRDMVEWSHGLLEEREQAIFARLGIFRGSFSLDAATAVLSEGNQWETLDLLARLASKSLLSIEKTEPPRYKLLETLRAYAFEKLQESDEFSQVAANHALYFDGLIYQTTIPPRSDGRAWMISQSPERDNLRAALDWALEMPQDRMQSAFRLGRCLIMLYDWQSLYAAGRNAAGRIIPLIREDDGSRFGVDFLVIAATLWLDTDRNHALRLVEQAISMYRKIKNTEPRQMLIEEAGKCFCLAGNLYALMGKYHTARQNFDEARALVQENGSVLSKANVYRSMTHLSLRENDFEEALRQGALLMEQVALMGNPTAKFPAMALIAEAEFGLGRVDKAISLTIECIDGYVKHKDTMRYCKQLTNLSLYYSTSQEYAKARTAAEESLKISRNEGGVVLWSCLQIWCLLGALNDRLKDAATLAGFLEAKQRNSAEVRASIELLAYTQIMNVLDTKLSTFETESCMARGATFTEAQAVSFTMKQLVASVSIPREQGQGPGFPLLEGRAE